MTLPSLTTADTEPPPAPQWESVRPIPGHFYDAFVDSERQARQLLWIAQLEGTAWDGGPLSHDRSASDEEWF